MQPEEPRRADRHVDGELGMQIPGPPSNPAIPGPPYYPESSPQQPDNIVVVLLPNGRPFPAAG